jgi:hypothetical protein
MIATANPVISEDRELKLLIEWSSPWQEFVTAVQPALAKSPRPLAGEAPTQIFPYRGILLTWVVEIVFLIAVIVIPAKLASLHPYEPPPLAKYDVIYYSGDELPQTEDLGGAQAGHAGRAGGKEAYHRTQVIHVSRGSTLREKVVDAPKLNLPRTDSAVANLLAYKPLPGPAPAEGLKPRLRAPALQENAAGPVPEIDRQKLKQAQAMSAAVVPPSPSGPQREFSAVRVPGSQMMAVVPPPVSAPEQMNNSHSQLTLPANVVAPPPTQITNQTLTKGPGFGAADLQRQIVPPPVQLSGSGNGRSMGGMGTADVVAPPVAISGPTGGRSTLASIGTANVVAPPIQVGGGSLHSQGMSGFGGGGSVVPPPVDATADGALTGRGHGNRGNGFGSPLDAGSAVAPPSTTGGNTAGNGIVLSSQPGAKVGVPGGGGAGSLALSPAGGLKPGFGGPGGGSDIAQGEGPGAAITGSGSGAANKGNGAGADLNARNGISPFPGPGGAGTGNVSKPAMPGVSVHGGSNVITLPSFGDSADPPATLGRSSKMAENQGPDITVVGTSRSGGAFNLYGTLKGDKVYTIYIDTILGTAVLEYADPVSATHPYAEDLKAPMPLRADLPSTIRRSRVVISCVLDRSGMLKKPQVLESSNKEMTAKLVAALSGWKFRPVFRGERPIEVDAILGFDIDTR